MWGYARDPPDVPQASPVHPGNFDFCKRYANLAGKTKAASRSRALCSAFKAEGTPKICKFVRLNVDEEQKCEGLPSWGGYRGSAGGAGSCDFVIPNTSS